MTADSSEFVENLPRAAHDFDFLFGEWRVLNHRLRERLVASGVWDEFAASPFVRPILGGLGNIDQYVTTLDGGYFEGASLRLFSLTDLQWRIYWMDTRFGNLQPPLLGSFLDGIGTFLGEDVHDGVPVTTRFLWNETTPRSARWEQAFSADGGATWETNWIMEFSRR